MWGNCNFRTARLEFLDSIALFLFFSDEIIINPDAAHERYLVASSNWGILHGLESFSQMVYVARENDYSVRKKNKKCGLIIESSEAKISQYVTHKTG